MCDDSDGSLRRTQGGMWSIDGFEFALRCAEAPCVFSEREFELSDFYPTSDEVFAPGHWEHFCSCVGCSFENLSQAEKHPEREIKKMNSFASRFVIKLHAYTPSSRHKSSNSNTPRLTPLYDL